MSVFTVLSLQHNEPSCFALSQPTADGFAVTQLLPNPNSAASTIPVRAETTAILLSRATEGRAALTSSRGLTQQCERVAAAAVKGETACVVSYGLPKTGKTKTLFDSESGAFPCVVAAVFEKLALASAAARIDTHEQRVVISAAVLASGKNGPVAVDLLCFDPGNREFAPRKLTNLDLQESEDDLGNEAAGVPADFWSFPGLASIEVKNVVQANALKNQALRCWKLAKCGSILSDEDEVNPFTNSSFLVEVRVERNLSNTEQQEYEGLCGNNGKEGEGALAAEKPYHRGAVRLIEVRHCGGLSSEVDPELKSFHSALEFGANSDGEIRRVPDNFLSTALTAALSPLLRPQSLDSLAASIFIGHVSDTWDTHAENERVFVTLRLIASLRARSLSTEQSLFGRIIDPRGLLAQIDQEIDSLLPFVGDSVFDNDQIGALRGDFDPAVEARCTNKRKVDASLRIECLRQAGLIAVVVDDSEAYLPEHTMVSADTSLEQDAILAQRILKESRMLVGMIQNMSAKQQELRALTDEEDAEDESLKGDFEEKSGLDSIDKRMRTLVAELGREKRRVQKTSTLLRKSLIADLERRRAAHCVDTVDDLVSLESAVSTAMFLPDVLVEASKKDPSLRQKLAEAETPVDRARVTLEWERNEMMRCLVLERLRHSLLLRRANTSVLRAFHDFRQSHEQFSAAQNKLWQSQIQDLIASNLELRAENAALRKQAEDLTRRELDLAL